MAWPLPFAALAVSLWVSVVFWIVLVAAFTFVWITTPNNSGTFGGALAAATVSYIHSHLVPVEFGVFTLSIYPMVLSLFLIWLIQAATKWAIRSVIFYHPASVLGLIGGVGLVHGVVLFLLALAMNDSINTTIATVNGFIFGVVGSTTAILRSQNEPTLEIPKNRYEIGERTKSWLKPQSPYLLVRDLLMMTPEVVRVSFTIAWTLVKALLVWSGLIALVTIAFRLSSFLEMVRLIAEDSSSSIAVIVWSFLYLPVLWLWQMFLMLGLTLNLGLGSVYSVFEQSVAPLPVVPAFALLPEQLPDWSANLLIGTALSVLFGVRKLYSGHLKSRFDWKYALKISAITTIFFTLMLISLNFIATGSIGAGRFEFIGFDILHVVLHSLVLVFLSLAFRALVWWFTNRQSQKSLLAE